MVISHRYVCFCLTNGFFEMNESPQSLCVANAPEHDNMMWWGFGWIPREDHIPPCQAGWNGTNQTIQVVSQTSLHLYARVCSYTLYIYIIHVYISKYITILYSCLSLSLLYIYIYIYIYALEVKAPVVSISIHLSHLSSSSYLPLCLLGFFFGSIGLLQSLAVRPGILQRQSMAKRHVCLVVWPCLRFQLGNDPLTKIDYGLVACSRSSTDFLRRWQIRGWWWWFLGSLVIFDGLPSGNLDVQHVYIYTIISICIYI